jgi:rare lipoprotein A
MNGVRLALVLLMGIMLIYDGYCIAARGLVSSLPFVQSGMASWYGIEQQGHRTANGETFNRHKLTAASRQLPFDTVVEVTNQKNGRSVEVRINDRGPFKKGRVIDLSEAAANRLDMEKSGTAPVKIQVVQPPSAESVTSP